jgi:hypothetical protein
MLNIQISGTLVLQSHLLHSEQRVNGLVVQLLEQIQVFILGNIQMVNMIEK